jgi:uncharacterized damage-inducible protein DinB
MDQKTRLNEPEPWLRGSLTEVPVVARAALHALELAKEDFERWAYGLTDEELNLRIPGVAPIAFHLRHVARSLDRLLSYAEGQQLNPEQIVLLQGELDPGANRTELFQELTSAFKFSAARIRALSSLDLNAKRAVGRKKLPTTLAGLLVHVADHTQRHVGQAVTTAKILLARRE